ncbi:MAG: DUF3179 domain-containing protein [Chloroflexota bacterium]
MEQLKNMPLWKLALPIIVVIGAISFLPSVLTTHAQSDNCVPSRFASQWSNTDFCNTSLDDFSSIISGGPGRDGIPAVDNPAMDTIEEASEWLVAQSPVIAVEIEGEARAYPQALLMWHEIANDEIGGVPVAVTFCPLCNSSIVFDRRVGDDTLTFGVSGNLRNSDMVMFDRETESWWQQFTGEGIVGDNNGVLLDIIPSQVIGFGQFAEQYPDGLVMNRDTGFNRQYGVNPYVGLDDSRGGVTSLFTGEYDERLPARERVLAGEVDGVYMAYPFSTLSEEIVINDTLGETEVVAFWQPGVFSSLDERTIDESQDVGTAALFNRTLEDGTVLTFTWDADAQVLLDDQTGSSWNLFGEATEGELAGTELQQLVAAPHYWFAWAVFEPETVVYGVDDE